MKFKKLLSVILAVMMVMTSLPTFATTSAEDTTIGNQAIDPIVAAGGTLIFSEDFESGYDLDTNLLDASATSVTLKKGDVNTFKFGYKDTTKQSVTVTKTSGLNSTNVLKLSSSDTANVLSNTIYLNGGSNISEDFDSKQIVVEYDILIPADSAALSKSNGIMSITTGASPYLKNAWNGKDLNAQVGYYPRSGNATDKDWYVRPTIKTATAKTIKYVVERNMTNFDSVRLYDNGSIVKSAFANKTDWNGGRIVKDFMNEENSGGYQIGGYATGATKIEFPKINYLYTAMIAKPAANATGNGLYATIYLDNIKVYAVDPIEFDGLASETDINPTDGLEVKFNQPFSATEDTFKVTTAEGADIADVIQSVTMSDDKMSANIMLDFSALEANTTYKVWVDDEFTSDAGAIFHKDLDGVAADEEYVELGSFETCTVLALESVDPETVSEYVQGADQPITLTFNDELALSDEQLADAFEVTDANDNAVTGLTAAFGADKKTVVLQLSTLTLGRGNHTIRSKANALYNAAGTYADVEYTFGTLDFNAVAEETEIEYIPTTDRTVVVNLTVPTVLTNENIATGFVVKDESDNEVSGLTATVDDTGMVISLQLNGLENLSTGTYTIDVTDALIDAAGRTAMLDEVITITVPEFMVVNEVADKFSMKPGEDKEVVIELSIPTALTEAELYDAFVVEDEEGASVAGLVVTLDDTRKVITLNLQGLDASEGKYTITSNETLVDEAGRNLVEAINISFEISEYVKIFEDDFENVDIGTDLFEVEGDRYTFSIPSNENNSATIVDGSDLGFDGNVLEIKNSGSVFDFYISLNNGDPIDTQSEDSPYYGKQLVYEFDVKAEGFKETSFMKIDSANGQVTPFQKISGSGWAVRNGPWQTEWYATANIDISSKRSMKVVFDQTGDVDVVRTYADGQLGTVNKLTATGSAFSGKIIKDFVGEHFKGQAQLNMSAPTKLTTNMLPTSGKTATVYIDNLKVYLVDSIDFAGEDEKVDFGENNSSAFNPTKGLDIAFTQRVDAEMLKKALIVTKATDAANTPIYNTIRNIKLSADGRNAHVQFEMSVLDAQTDYNLWIDDEFTSAYGAIMFTNPLGVSPEDEMILLTNFTTCDKLETTVVPASISGYDKGVDKTVTITLSSPLKSDITDIAGIFEVTDADENVISGLIAEISDDRTVITLQLSGLQLGNGVHLIATKEGALVNEDGIEGSAVVVVNTLDFVGIASPTEGGIMNYIEGSAQKVQIDLTIPTTIADADVASAFVVEDENSNPVSGLGIKLSENKKTFTLDISTLKLGVGKHTIKSTEVVTDSRGRTLGLTYGFSILPFYAQYPAEVTEYTPGSEQTIEIELTYPLSAESVNKAVNAFTVKNQYGSNVSGLGVTVSEDNKIIVLNLATLDIEGGEYAIASKPGVFVNTKGEVLADIAITLSTATITEDEESEDVGVGPNPGSEMTDDFISTVLLSENFDNEGYTRDVNWLSSSSFVPGGFALDIVGKGNQYVDAEVKIVKDPADPDGDNYVLKNVAGFRDSTGTVIAGTSNYHRVKRELDSGAPEAIPVDNYTVVKLSTKVYIPKSGSAGMPTNDSGAVGNTKDTAKIISLANENLSAVGHANLRKNSAGTAQYNSYINSGETASATSGSVVANLTADKWHTIDLIFGYNPKKDGTMFKSYEVWVDGVKITALGGYYAANYATVGGMLSTLATATGGSGTTTVYYDDWSITKGTRLATHVNVEKVEVKEDQIIKLQLTNKLTDDSVALIEAKELISLKDSEGNDVEATIAIDNTGANTKVVITPAYGLKYQTDYVIAIEKEYVNDKGIVSSIKDVDGNLFGGFTYSFKTAKAKTNSIDVDSCNLTYDADYMHNEDTFNYTMALKEAVDTTPIIGAVATFSEDNKLLGIDYKVFNPGEITKAFTVSSELGAKYIRLFLWEQNEDGTMGRLMQIPDEVTSR